MDKTVKNLMFDRALNREIYDVETDRVISAEEADEKIRQVVFEKLGLSKDASPRQINRAMKRESALELFELIEEVIDVKVATGWHSNEFFNEFVEDRNLADGDAQTFYTDKEIFLDVAHVSGSHHDHIVQKLGEGTPFTVPVSWYCVKVGTDIRLFLTGRRSWSEFIDAVAKAFVKQIQEEVYTAFAGAANRIPPTSQFNKTGQIAAGTKDTFDELIEDVETANEVPAVIMGTKTALKKLNGWADVNWIAESQKEAYANSGIMGVYEGNLLVEIPQRFVSNDTGNKLVDSTKLYIMPQIDNKFVKFVDGGETTLEVTEVGETMNDQQTYEVHRRMGVAAIISRYFGVWTIQ